MFRAVRLVKRIRTVEKEDGFTLAELLVGIFVSLIMIMAIGFLLTTQVQAFMFYRKVAEERQRVSEAQAKITDMLRVATSFYAADSGPYKVSFLGYLDGSTLNYVLVIFNSQMRKLEARVGNRTVAEVLNVTGCSVEYYGYRETGEEVKASNLSILRDSGVVPTKIKIGFSYEIAGYGRSKTERVEFFVTLRNTEIVYR